MNTNRFNNRLIVGITTFAVIFSFEMGCAKHWMLKTTGSGQCEEAEKNIGKYIEGRRKQVKFRRDLPLRSVLVPLSLAAGFAMNWFGGTIVQLPLLTPKGREVKVKGPMLLRMLTFTRIKGSRLDDLDIQTIAEANYDVALCHYDSGEYDEAISYLMFIYHDIYLNHVGRDNFHYLLGMAYYQTNHFKEAQEELKYFMIYSKEKDKRRPEAGEYMEKLEILKEAGFW